MKVSRLFITFFVLVAFSTGLTGQTTVKSNQNDDSDVFGEVRQNVYRNSAFGFEFSVPKDWIVGNSDDLATVNREGRQSLSKDYKISKAAIDQNAKIETISLVVSRREVGATRNAVMGFSLTKQASETVTPKMIAESAKPIFVGKNETVLEKDVSQETIGERGFATFEMMVNSSLGKQHVKVFITMIKDYALTFATTYWDESDRKLMEDSIRSIKFTEK